MSGFESEPFKKRMPNVQQKPLREFTVGDSSDFQEQEEELQPAELERRIKAARQEKLESTTKINDSAKKRIEILANIGRLSKDITLDDILFSIRTLKSKEMKDATLASLNVNTNVEVGFEIKKQILARAIYKIDNNDIKYILGSDELENKLSFVDELEEIVVNKLYDEFQLLRNEVKAKYSIESEKDAKEVAEDLKK